MSFRQLKQSAHKVFAGFMAIWLSGVVFLFCCDTTNAATDSVEFCPLAKVSAHCDKASQADIADITVAADEYSVDCCGFLPAIFDKARKLEQAQKQTAAVHRKPIVPRVRTATVSHTPLLTAFQPYIDWRQKLFIQNCVFRI